MEGPLLAAVIVTPLVVVTGLLARLVRRRRPARPATPPRGPGGPSDAGDRSPRRPLVPSMAGAIALPEPRVDELR